MQHSIVVRQGQFAFGMIDGPCPFVANEFDLEGHKEAAKLLPGPHPLLVSLFPASLDVDPNQEQHLYAAHIFWHILR